MTHTWPTPRDLGVKVPTHLVEQRFRAGFQHALEGKQLTRVEHLKLSFREGYRAAKLVIRERRRQQGILTFPVQGRMTG